MLTLNTFNTNYPPKSSVRKLLYLFCFVKLHVILESSIYGLRIYLFILISSCRIESKSEAEEAVISLEKEVELMHFIMLVF